MSFEQFSKEFFDINVLKQEIRDIKQKMESKDNDLTKLKELVSIIASQQKRENPTLPIDTQTGRLDMEEFVKRGIYSLKSLADDKDRIKQLEDKWLTPEPHSNKIDYVEKRINGEKIELLTMEVLYKFLNQDFIIVRSARHDDVENGVDTIIFNKDSRGIVCALDESGAFFGQYAVEKRSKTNDKNEEGGADLKYGLILTKDSNNQNIIKGGQVSHIPLFNLLINFFDINEYLSELTNNLKDISKSERILFIYFAQDINSQLKKMQNSPNISIGIKQSGQEFISKVVALYPNILYSEQLVESRKKGFLRPEFYTLPKKITNSQERDTFREKAIR